MATGGAYNEATTTGWYASTRFEPSGRTPPPTCAGIRGASHGLPSPGSTVGGSPWNR